MQRILADKSAVEVSYQVRQIYLEFSPATCPLVKHAVFGAASRDTIMSCDCLGNNSPEEIDTKAFDDTSKRRDYLQRIWLDSGFGTCWTFSQRRGADTKPAGNRRSPRCLLSLVAHATSVATLATTPRSARLLSAFATTASSQVTSPTTALTQGPLRVSQRRSE